MRTRVAFFLLLAALALPTGGLDRHPWPAALEVRSAHYVVETNTFPELADSLRRRVEEAYVCYEDRFGPLPDGMPMRIALFRTADEYRRLGGGPEGAVGHFDAALDRCALLWRGGTGEDGWPVAVHEACHHYLRRRHPTASVPSWYGEGIACYFEGLLDPGTQDGVARMRVGAARRALADGEAQLALLLDARAEVRDGRLELEHFKASRFYGLAWSLVHFLARDPATREGFRRFELRLFAAQAGPGRRESLAAALLADECGDLARLEERWREHIAALPEPTPARTPPVYAWELSSPNPYVRYAALRRLEGTDGLAPDLRPGLARCVRDADLVVRTAAAELASGNMDASLVPPLVAALDLGDPALKSAALLALAFPGAREAVPRLLAEREEPEAALAALVAIGDPRAFPLLREAVRDPLLPAVLRARCVTLLAADPRAEAPLKGALLDREPVVRTAARTALGRREDREEILDEREQARLLDVLRGPTRSFAERRHACRMLAMARVEAAVPLLQRLCRPQEEDRLRLEAVRALVRITGETRGYEPGQRATAREAALRAWAEEE